MAGAAPVVDTARTALGMIGNVISSFLFLSPMPSVLDSVRWRSTRDYSMLPYLLTFLNCLLWILYAVPTVHPHSVLVLSINSAGAAIELVYICFFIVLAPTLPERRKRMGGFCLLLFVYCAIVVLVLKWWPQDSRAFVVGIFCAVCGTCMYAAPLMVMRRVIQTRSVEFMPFWLSLASLLNALVWTAYATIHLEMFVMIPNALGIVLGAGQLSLYATYYNPKVKAAKAHPSVDLEAQLPSVKSTVACSHSSNQPSVESTAACTQG